jgi:cytochrome c oxidase subunit 2
MFFMAAIGVIVLLVIALSIPWFPTHASQQADRISTLYNVLLIVSIPVFVLVETVVIYSVWKFRMRPGEELKDGPPIHGNTRLEVMWTAAPALLIVSLCIYAFAVLHADESSKKGEMTVNVTERQFAFEFTYPDVGGKTFTSAQLYLPNNEPVVFKLRSLDVIHSFFVPEFSEKLDAVPGIVTILRVTPNRLGNYDVECTELCGSGHSLMRSLVHVLTPAAFQTWAQAQSAGAAPPIGLPEAGAAQPGVPGSTAAPVPATPAPAPSTSTTSTTTASTTPAVTQTTAAPSTPVTAAAGKALFVGTGGCGACHTLAAAGSTGTIGPNLTTQLAADCKLAASIKVRGKTLTQCVSAAITNPYAFIPKGFHSGIMPPNFSSTLTASQIKSLVLYLTSVTK